MTDPKAPNFNSPLVFDRDYHLWRSGKYLGIATYKDDRNIGHRFIKEVVRPKGSIERHVYTADKWTII